MSRAGKANKVAPMLMASNRFWNKNRSRRKEYSKTSYPGLGKSGSCRLAEYLIYIDMDIARRGK
jgi:hypothetical protein